MALTVNNFPFLIFFFFIFFFFGKGALELEFARLIHLGTEWTELTTCAGRVTLRSKILSSFPTGPSSGML